MLKIIFYIKTDKVNTKGESPIFARISYKQKNTTMATGKSILKERWQFTNNLRNVLKLEKEKVIKNALDLFQLNVEKKFNELIKIDTDISLHLLKNEFNGKSNSRPKDVSILEIIEQHNKYFEKKVIAEERTKASFQKYERSKTLLINFMSKQYKIKDIAANEITSAFIYNLEAFLKYESDFKGTNRQKTESASKIPILPVTQMIIDKYDNHPQCLNENRLLPILSNQKMNAYLKEIAGVCEIDKELTFHIARHTFATTVTLTNGVPIESVSKMLGHKNIRTTQHYAKVLDKKVSEDMKILKEKMNLTSRRIKSG